MFIGLCSQQSHLSFLLLHSDLAYGCLMEFTPLGIAEHVWPQSIMTPNLMVVYIFTSISHFFHLVKWLCAGITPWTQGLLTKQRPPAPQIVISAITLHLLPPV